MGLTVLFVFGLVGLLFVGGAGLCGGYFATAFVLAFEELLSLKEPLSDVFGTVADKGLFLTSFGIGVLNSFTLCVVGLVGPVVVLEPACILEKLTSIEALYTFA